MTQKTLSDYLPDMTLLADLALVCWTTIMMQNPMLL